jgi:hypothetical protein
MKEQLYTIDINQAFDQAECCPLCELEHKREDDVLTYILGPAMMEPAIRIETNVLGFCRRHLTAMQKRKNKLSLALMLESLMIEINKNPAKGISKRRGTCYLCARIQHFRLAVTANIAHMWKSEPEFKAKLEHISGFCMPHAAMLCDSAVKHLGKKNAPDYIKCVTKAAARQSVLLQQQISAFCQSFDHRNAGQELGGAKAAVEKACSWLGGYV